MLIDPGVVKATVASHGIEMRGILHAGAHLCEEKHSYNTIWEIRDENIVWVEGNPSLTARNKKKGIPNCFTSILDETERECAFHIASNNQSSSILSFGTHAHHYPHIVVVDSVPVRAETLEQFLLRSHLDPAHYNVWNFDIQGAELRVLRGSARLLRFVDVLYTEVNTADVYEGCGRLWELDCFLQEHGLHRVLTSMTEASWGDALYLRSRVSPG